jgi:hypothetical protein
MGPSKPVRLVCQPAGPRFPGNLFRLIFLTCAADELPEMSGVANPREDLLRSSSREPHYSEDKKDDQTDHHNPSGYSHPASAAHWHPYATPSGLTTAT